MYDEMMCWATQNERQKTQQRNSGLLFCPHQHKSCHIQLKGQVNRTYLYSTYLGCVCTVNLHPIFVKQKSMLLKNMEANYPITNIPSLDAILKKSSGRTKNLEFKSAVHVLLFRFYPDFLKTHFIQILSRLYPNVKRFPQKFFYSKFFQNHIRIFDRKEGSQLSIQSLLSSFLFKI